MIIKDIISKLENLAPVEYSEKYDNIGLIIGSSFKKVNNILITLDVTEKVVYESINKKCNLIISFHPIIFKPINSITYKSTKEKIIILSIKNNISIYVIHTNLDMVWNGSTSYISNLLKIKREKVLIPKKGTMKKLSTYVPVNYANKVRNSLFKAGAGNISNYSNCSYNFDGFGSYIGNKNSNPFLGKKEVINFEKETCINVIFPYYKLKKIKKALFKSHPYEEVAYEIYSISNTNPYIGLGFVGHLKKEISEYEFLLFLKKKMNLFYIQHTNFLNRNVKKISIITGSGQIGIDYAIKEKSDVFITSDLKYHDFFKSENKILIVNIDHYKSEKLNKKLLKTFINNSFPTIFVYESKINTNPIKYFY